MAIQAFFEEIAHPASQLVGQTCPPNWNRWGRREFLSDHKGKWVILSEQAGMPVLPGNDL
jgi:hypothetical protein